LFFILGITFFLFEINLALPQNKQQAHKVLNYKKAQWDQIEKDLTETYKQLKKDQDKMSLDELWNEASGLLGMTAGVFQSMWPRLKSPLTQMLEFVFLHKTLFSEIPSCSNDLALK
jgi:hypothetical protein